MADLTVNNLPSPPETQPWLIPLPIPLHQLSFTCIDTSCMAQISPFFPRLCLTFFKHYPSIFPANPQGFTPPPGLALTTPYATINNYGAYRFDQSGPGFYGAGGGSCFVGPYGYLCLPPIQFQLKVYGRLQTGTSMEQQEQQHNRISASRPRIVELESRGTGVFHAPDINHGPCRNKKRRRKRGKRNENNGGVEETVGGSRRSADEEGIEQQEEEEECRQSEPDYDVVLPSDWPY